ncbi:unnamed protein product [Enterobius vermicularis]|uniref:Ribonuclease T(2) n=1 Tax=Enterobius vermicularis TaxID=51028 RepID=A0A0N4V9Y1_ENTVE|nr:unnamed protein product [Enterobius vermicularis]
MNAAPPYQFDYFLFTQIYPTAVCYMDNSRIPGKCKVPKAASSWTIHGLWPALTNNSKYGFCKGEKFNLSTLTTIVSSLERNWPNVYPEKSESSLW